MFLKIYFKWAVNEGKRIVNIKKMSLLSPVHDVGKLYILWNNNYLDLLNHFDWTKTREQTTSFQRKKHTFCFFSYSVGGQQQ